jgi:hypothetical protein
LASTPFDSPNTHHATPLNHSLIERSQPVQSRRAENTALFELVPAALLDLGNRKVGDDNLAWRMTFFVSISVSIGFSSRKYRGCLFVWRAVLTGNREMGLGGQG